MDNRRKRTDLLSYVTLAILFTMFCLVLFALTMGNVKAEYGALIGGYGTVILGLIAIEANWIWGGSKDNQMKGEAAQAAKGAVVREQTTTTKTVNSGPPPVVSAVAADESGAIK